MPYVVKKSFVRDVMPDFEVMVASHAHEMKQWLERQRRVAADAENPNIPDIERWVMCPKPDAPNAVVESAVNESGEAEYEIENDDPNPEELLPVKKEALIANLLQAESAARNAIMPAAKRPLRQILTDRLLERDAQNRARIMAEGADAIVASIDSYNDEVNAIMQSDPGLLARVATRVGLIQDPRVPKAREVLMQHPDPLDVESEVVKARSQEDADFVRENEIIALADQRIMIAVAHAMSDIHDLTVDTVDAYTIPNMNEQA